MQQLFWKTLLFSIVLLLSCQKDNGNPAPEPEPEPMSEDPLPDGPTRGVWLTNVDSDALTSRDKIQAAVDLCYKYKINTIFMVVWNKGFTLFPSAVMEQTFGVKIDPSLGARDPLQELIELAKPRGIKVYAWFEYGFASSYGAPSDGGPLLQKKPHWAGRDSAGKILSKNNFQWMNALHPEVQDFMISLVKEVVAKYDITGIQGDDRLPAMPSEGGYDSLTVARYKAQFGVNPPANSKDAAWVDWRAKQLNDFGKRLYQEVKTVKPGIVVSMSPSIFPWSKEEYLQDWPAWVKEGYADMVCPQIYRYDLGAYQGELSKIVNQQLTATEKQRLFPGILLKVGSYTASATFLEQMVQENRRNGVKGEVFFFFEGLKAQPAFFEKYKTL
jgi:uncharacterized lipoprotein YddW (UPF0748 family)